MDKEPLLEKEPRQETPDGEPSKLKKKINEKVSLLSIEAPLIFQQREAQKQSLNFKHFRVLTPEDDLDDYLDTAAKAFLFSFSVPPYYVPIDGVKAAPEIKADIFKFAPIRPSKFPNKLLEHFYGTKFKFTKHSPEKYAERMENVEKLREIFKEAMPLMHVEKAENGAPVITSSNRILTVPKTENHKGGFLVSRMPTTRNGKQKIFSYFKDIYTLKRSQIHIIGGYTGKIDEKAMQEKPELEFLKMLREKIQELLAFLRNYWRHATKQEKEGMKELISDLEMQLKGDSDKYKTATREHLLAGMEAKDETLFKELLEAFNNTAERTANVLKIIPHIQRDLGLLTAVQTEYEEDFSTLKANVYKSFSKPYFQPFGQIKLAITYIPNNAFAINRGLLSHRTNEGIMSEMKRLNQNPNTPSPYATWSKAVTLKMRELYQLNLNLGRREVEPEDVEKVHDQSVQAALEAWLILQYQELQVKITKLMEGLLQGSVPLHHTIENARQILHDFDPHRFGDPFKVRDDKVFTDNKFASISNYLSRLIALAEKSNLQILEIEEKIHSKKQQMMKNIHTRDLNEFVSLEDELIAEKRKKIQVIYDFLRKCPELVDEPESPG